MNRLDRIEHAAKHTLLDVKGFPVVEDIRALIRVARAAEIMQKSYGTKTQGELHLFNALVPLLEEV